MKSAKLLIALLSLTFTYAAFGQTGGSITGVKGGVKVSHRGGGKGDHFFVHQRPHCPADGESRAASPPANPQNQG